MSGMPLLYKHPKVPKRPLYWAPSRQTAPQKKCKNFMSAVVAFSPWVWQVNARCAMRRTCAHARNPRKGTLPRTSIQGECLWMRLGANWTHPDNTLPSMAWALLESVKKSVEIRVFLAYGLSPQKLAHIIVSESPVFVQDAQPCQNFSMITDILIKINNDRQQRSWLRVACKSQWWPRRQCQKPLRRT